MLKIAGYELIDKIAEGGMASVWKARQVSLDRVVAIKVLDRSSLPDESALERFRKEARTAARLNHPNIVQVYDTGEVDGHAYLVMEFVEGTTVGETISLHGAMAESLSLEIIEKTCEALAYAWDKECLIHCDVNPNNILIERDTGHVKVTDLGIARMIGLKRRENEDSGLIVGTPNYTSPEQSAGIDDLDCRTDMYSVGATLYHMLTGQLPFHDAKRSEAMTRHEEDFLDDPKDVNPELSAPAAWLVEKLMIKNRALRPLYWTDVIADIRRVRKGQLPDKPLPEEGASTVRRSAKRGMAVPGGGARKVKVKLAVQKPPPSAVPRETEPEGTTVNDALKQTILLLFAAGVVYAAFYFYGRIRGKPEPVVIEPPVVETVQEEAPAADEAADDGRETAWRNDDFIAGAKLFNKALADYNAYQKDRSNPDVLVSVEENCRDAIAHFEACKDDAPERINIDQYINQSYGLISNVRQSTLIDSAEKAMSSGSPAAAPRQVAELNTGKRRVVFVDDEPDESAEPMEEPEPVELLLVSLNVGWDSPGLSGGASGTEIAKLLRRHTRPTRETGVDPNVVLYPRVTCMMKAREAAEALGQELPPSTVIEAPGLMAGSLHSYSFEGSFLGASRLTVVCDRNDRVVMTQLFDDRPVPSKMSEALFSDNWTVYDFIGGRTRNEADEKIAHQVRRRNGMVRIDTELVDTAEEGIREAKARVILMMPVRFAGMLLQAGGQ